MTEYNGDWLACDANIVVCNTGNAYTKVKGKEEYELTEGPKTAGQEAFMRCVHAMPNARFCFFGQGDEEDWAMPGFNKAMYDNAENVYTRSNMV